MKLKLQEFERFDTRHNAPNDEQVAKMLEVVKANSIEDLIDETIPKNIRLKKEFDLPTAKSEFQFLADFKKIGL